MMWNRLDLLIRLHYHLTWTLKPEIHKCIHSPVIHYQLHRYTWSQLHSQVKGRCLFLRNGPRDEIKPWHNQINVRFFKKRREKVPSSPGLPTIQFLFTYHCKNKGGRFAPLTYVTDVNVYPGTKKTGGITYHIRRSPLVPTLEEQRNGSTFSPHHWGSEEWLHL